MSTVPASIIAFVFLWFVLRVMGKSELSEISAFDLVIVFVMGDLIAESVIREDTSTLSAVTAIGTLALLTTLLSWLSWRFDRLRPTLEGLPTIIVRDGKLIDDALRIERISTHDLYEAAREKGIAELSTVELAILEPDGAFSFFTRTDH